MIIADGSVSTYGNPSLPRARLNRSQFRKDLRRTFVGSAYITFLVTNLKSNGPKSRM